MRSSDRLHALDAVRAFALLLGIVLHAAQSYVAGLGWVTAETPNTGLAALWYTIHLFRMPLFFLIAGFFARMLLESRGLAGFVKDRARRILLPLVVGLPVVMLLTGVAYVLGSLASGADPRAIQGMHPPAAPIKHAFLTSIPLIHLWFLYYLLLFYAGAVLLRLASDSVFGPGRLQAAVDAIVRFLMRGPWGVLILSLPIVAYYAHLSGWSPWGGLPAPFYLVPDAGALIAYGLFFGFGWLLHRQPPVLLSLQNLYPLYSVLAIAAWIACRMIGGPTPHWGPYLQGGALLGYTLSYIVGAWAWSFALIGIAVRFLSGASAVRRYLADSSYWLYLMHIPVLFFFERMLHPLPWPGVVKFVLVVAGAMPILLLSYHYLVRFTFIGATLNGRRALRSATEEGRARTGDGSRRRRPGLSFHSATDRRRSVS